MKSVRLFGLPMTSSRHVGVLENLLVADGRFEQVLVLRSSLEVEGLSRPVAMTSVRCSFYLIRLILSTIGLGVA
jgi:hypothetical protein